MVVGPSVLFSRQGLQVRNTSINPRLRARIHKVKSGHIVSRDHLSETTHDRKLSSAKRVIQCSASVRPKVTSSSEAGATSAEVVPVMSGGSERFSPDASKQLSTAIKYLRKFGWLGFWTQLTLTLSSAGVLLFSIAYAAQTGPKISFYLTTLGVSASFLSVFQFFGLVTLSRKLKKFFEAPLGANVKKITKEKVVNSVSQGIFVAVVGLGSAIIGMQAAVGVLIAKTLTSSSVNPFVAASQGGWNPVLAFDIFLLQSSTNTMLSHFVGLAIYLWLMVRLRNRNLWTSLFGVSKFT